MKKIGILSDTHGLLRPEVLQLLRGCDAILHGGDINRQEILSELEQIAPVYAVRGNNDKEWAEHLPGVLDFELYGLHIYMTHKKKDLPKDLSPYDLAVYGHSHRYEQREEGRTYLINPGSCGPRRFNQSITLAKMEMNEQDGEIMIQRIDIPAYSTTSVKKETVRKQDIEKVIREIKKKRSVEEISSKLPMDPELTEQICRLYLTHPGVTADGIMTKLGL